MDPAVFAILKGAELHHGADLYSVDSPTILINNVSNWKGHKLVADILEAPLPLAANWKEDIHWKGLNPSGRKVYFDHGPDMYEEIMTPGAVILKGFKTSFPIEDMDTRSMHLTITEQSVIIPWYRSVLKPRIHIDWFCGGFGGWSFAKKAAQNAGWPEYTTIGVEIDLPLAAQHAINHGGILVPDQPLPAQWFCKQQHDVTLQADIHHLKSIQALACTVADFWSGSFPCQSFTNTAFARGLKDPSGHSFVQLMALARQMRPAVIALENVKNFKEHSHYGTAIKIIHWCGYRVVHEKILNIQDRLPIQRPRWLCILQRIEDPPMAQNWTGWGPIIAPCRPADWDAWMTTPPEDMPTFQPTREAWNMYLDPALLPAYAPYYAPRDMIRYRIPSLQQKVQVVLAMYGAQHELPPTLLKQKGLLGFFTAEDNKPRFWNPMELALLHLQHEPLALLRPAKLSWKAIGNCIVLHHAFVAIVHAFDLMHPRPADFSMHQTLEHLEATRLKASTLSLVADEYGWCIAGTAEQAQHLNDQIRHMSISMGWTNDQPTTWPEHSFYHPAQGCCNVADVLVPQTPQQPTEIKPTLRDEEKVEPAMDTMIDTATHEAPHSVERYIRTWEQQHVHAFMPDTPRHDRAPEDESMSSSASTEPDQLTRPSEPEHNTMEDWVEIALFPIPGTYGSLVVSSELRYDDLLRLWNYKIFPVELMHQTTTLPEITKKPVKRTMLIPRWLAHQELTNPEEDEKWVEERLMQCTQDAVLLMTTPTATLAVPTKNHTWDELTFRFLELPNVAYSEWGIMNPTTIINHAMRLHLTPQTTEAFVNVSALVEGIPLVDVIYQTPDNTDILVVHMSGPTDALSTVSTLWHVALDETWQELHGRQVTFQATSASSIRFVIRPNGKIFATPTTMLMEPIAAKLCQSMLQSVHQPDATNHLRIKDFQGTMTTIGITY